MNERITITIDREQHNKLVQIKYSNKFKSYDEVLDYLLRLEEWIKQHEK